MYKETTVIDQETVSKPTILIIDDNRDIRGCLKLFLQNDYQVYCAENVDEAMGLLNERRPHLVITDYEMPGKNGICGIREMRKTHPHLSIIMLTGSATPELIEEAINEGAADCMGKPFRVQALRSMIERYVAKPSAA